MPTLPFKPALLLVLTLLLSSCAPQAAPSLIPLTEQSATSTPILQPTEQVVPTPKHPRGTKAPGNNPGQGQGSNAIQNMPFDVPAQSFNVILGRPTDNSITLSMLAVADQTVSIEYGTSYASHTDPVILQAHIPREITLTALLLTRNTFTPSTALKTPSILPAHLALRSPSPYKPIHTLTQIPIRRCMSKPLPTNVLIIPISS